eukprot:9090598-Lingulodinium_polyedra.AAC.1
MPVRRWRVPVVRWPRAGDASLDCSRALCADRFAYLYMTQSRFTCHQFHIIVSNAAGCALRAHTRLLRCETSVGHCALAATVALSRATR